MTRRSDDDERTRAKAWWRRHGSKVPDVLKRERVHGDGDPEWGKTNRYTSLLEEMEELDVVYDEKHRFMPLQGHDRPVDLQSAAMSARVKRVLSFLRDEQRSLLWAVYVQGAKLEEVRHDGESRQAVHERLAWARKAFLKAWLDHAEDPIELTEEDF